MSLPLLEHLHGHLGVLAVALLFHPAILLWRGQPLSRGGRWAVSATLAMVVVAFAFGLWIYPPYRDLVRHDLMLIDPDAALLFEVKEHLAWGALASALGAGCAALVAPRSAIETRKIAARAFAASATLATSTGLLGIHIAALHTFPGATP